MKKTGEVKSNEMRLTLVYDNNEYDRRAGTGWGFGCVAEGLEQTILFDTGGDGVLLLSNMQKLGLDPRRVDTVFLSHAHGDHVGGLSAFLAVNPKVTVCMLRSFPTSLKTFVEAAGADLLEVDKPLELCPHVWSTGELGRGIKEQSLVVDTRKGLLLITGCAHPGIVSIARHAKKTGGRDVHTVLGGFHLSGASADRIRDISAQLKGEHVRVVVPCHCSGELARSLFQESYGQNCLAAGVGWQHTLEKPQ